ncbi:fasciclin-3 isoform X2 [Venturia canescens]|uniref:fasciclin-3 isoform X2 n=1 Tax=Venturia canescens TaxID=32260 RepID=UPI001C9D2731|nr:fasciclin-3 isoform X2 [Venturia canescens]
MCKTTMAGRTKMTSATAIWTCVAVILATSVQTVFSASKAHVTISPSGTAPVRLGDSLTILCTVDSKIDICRVEIPGEQGMYLSPNQKPEDGIEYFGTGKDAGQCGARIARVKESHNGLFKCMMNMESSRKEVKAEVTIVVAKPPNNPEIYLSPGSRGDRIYISGDRLEISCIARSGRPAANLSLYLDDEPLTYESRPTYDYAASNSSIAVLNVSHSVDWTDHGKMVRCIAHHIALDRPKETKQELQVEFAPQPQPTLERFGYVIGRPGIVNVTVRANPRPLFIWHINGEQINEGRPDESNRLETSTAVDLGKGTWGVELRIDNVQKSDTEKEYALEARNDQGAYKYVIILSTSVEPSGVDLDAGSIIGIAVGVLVLILVIFLIIFARATGRWCFAGGSSTRNIGESSDTESAGRYSRTEVDGGADGRRRRPKITLSRLFKRNKDKVSGADTDTMRTVVTVDDEKVQTGESENNSQRANPSSEGGIVYAELDLTQQQQGIIPRRLNEDKTEYAEIIYTKPAEGNETQTPEK